MQTLKLSHLSKALRVSVAAMRAQDQRVFIVTQNLANANVRSSSPDKDPYRRKTITFKSVFDKSEGVNVLSVETREDTTPFNKVYSPSDPAADTRGFVLEPNVRPLVELMDLREASRAHEASLRAFERVLSMIQNNISLLKTA